MSNKSIMFIIILCAQTLLQLTMANVLSHINLLPGAPLYTESAFECMSKINHEIIECQTIAYNYWHENDRVITMPDDCCAKWYYMDCIVNLLQSTNKTTNKCNETEAYDMINWLSRMQIYYINYTCAGYGRDSAICALPVLHNILLPDDRPPVPDLSSKDCINKIEFDSMLDCARSAERQFNVTTINGTKQQLCCALWQNIDCFSDLASSTCADNDHKALNKYFDQFIEYIQEVECEDNTYGSAVCQQTVDEIPVLTDSSDPLLINISMDDYNVNHGINSKLTLSGQAISIVGYNGLAKRDKTNMVIPVYDDDQQSIYFDHHLLEYLITILPYLMILMAMLALVLMIVIAMQCYLIRHQLKNAGTIMNGTSEQGYQKIYNKM